MIKSTCQALFEKKAGKKGSNYDFMRQVKQIKRSYVEMMAEFEKEQANS